VGRFPSFPLLTNQLSPYTGAIKPKNILKTSKKHVCRPSTSKNIWPPIKPLWPPIVRQTLRERPQTIAKMLK
jgi:hypothetical protein